MLPNDIVLLDDFPYLPSGKVDKKKLGSDYSSKAPQKSAEPSDVSEIASNVARTIQSVLGAPIDHNTDLGAAGLDSLRAIQIASELRKQGYAGFSALELLSVSNVLALDQLLQNKASSNGVHENDAREWESILHELRSNVEATLESETA
ncbi:hypothetical protein KCU67_g16096, partial [Aureobasidium melanogenum]